MTVYHGCVRDTTRQVHRWAELNMRFALTRLREADVFAMVVIHELIHLLPHEPHGDGLGGDEW